MPRAALTGCMPPILSRTVLMRTIGRLLLAGIAASLSVPSTTAAAPKMVVERAILVMRHGIRAPLGEEVPEGTRTSAPWARWPVAESRVTPHGARALEIVAREDRLLFAAHGLLPPDGCPGKGDVRIWTNTSERTIASGVAYARGFAPQCALPVEHRASGEADPLFEPLRTHATRFDAATAVADIERDTGGMAALVRRHAAGIAQLDRVLGCTPRAGGCVPFGVPRVLPADAGRSIELQGAIRATSGVAQVLLLQYVEGLPLGQVGWGRADPATLRRIGALHAALFTVFTRPPYMAAHQTAALGSHILAALSAREGPRVELLMGHDTNVTALAAALRVDLRAPGYAVNDVPPGGAILIEQLRDTRSGRAFVRASYRTQSPGTLRALGRATTLRPLRIAGCGAVLCAADTFATLLRGRIAPLAKASSDER
jgi:4-phytase / acid phosphatase